MFKSCHHIVLCLFSGQNLLCHLISEEEGSVAHAAVKHAGISPERYHMDALEKVGNVQMMTWLD